MPKNVIEHVFDHGFIHIKILARKVIYFVQHVILFCVLSRRGGLLKFIFMQISPNLPGGLTNPDFLFLGQTLMKVKPNEMKLVVKFVQKWNLIHSYKLARKSRHYQLIKTTSFSGGIVRQCQIFQLFK